MNLKNSKLTQIYDLLSKEDKKRGVVIALSVLLRTLLDFAGIAALIPVLLTIFGHTVDVKKALLVCLAALVFVLFKNALSVILARFQSSFLLDLYNVNPTEWVFNVTFLKAGDIVVKFQ